MRSPLHARIASLRGRVRRLLALHGLSLVVAGLAVFVLFACLGDWAIHLSREIRVALLATFVGLAGYLLLRYVVAPLVVRFRDLDIAMKIERRWPGLNDRLASTIQFLDLERAGVGDRDDVLGSRALRAATVKQTLAETEGIDFRSVVDPRPARKALLVAFLTVATGLSIFATDRRMGSLALKRLFLPFASNPWPQMTHLAILKAPGKVARGETFQLEVGVAEGERAPSSAKITYRYEGGEIATESLRPDNKDRFHGRKESVEKSFDFTIAAGDDATQPRHVAVVPPPAITNSTVKLTYPAYTGLPAQVLAPGQLQATAVRGTTVEIHGFANKPLANAALARGEGLPPIMMTIGGPKRSELAAKFTLEDSGPVTFVMKDTEGFASQERDAVRFDLRMLKDEAPKVTIDDPTSDRDVTANADVPVEITADDDFGLADIRLVYKVSPGGSEPLPEVTIPLWKLETAQDKALTPTKHRAVKHLWKLEPLNLPPNSVITYHAESRDLDNLRGPNVGKSRELHLRVVTPEQLAPQIEAQRREIREEIERTLAMQKQAMQPVRDAIRMLNQADKLDETRRDDVKNAEPAQQQVTDRIANKADGLEAKIRKHLDDLANLKIDNPDNRAQMEDLLGGAQKLRSENVGPAEQGLTRASKALDADGKQGEPSKGNDPGQPDAKDQGRAENGASEKSAPGKAESKSSAAKGQSSKSQNGEAKSGESKSGESKADAAEKSGGSEKGQSDSGEKSQGGEKSQAGQKAQGGEKSQGGNSKSQSGQPKGANDGQQQPPKPQQDAAPNSLKDSLALAEKNQKAIADELQRMRDTLGEFETLRGITQDAKGILKQHEDAMKAGSELAQRPDLADKPADGLTPQQKADLAAAADRQAEAARNLANLENKMEDLSKRNAESDPASSAALKDAAQQSRERGTSGKMDKASSGLEKNQMGQAQGDQKSAQQDLKKLIDNLQNRRENELARLVKDLKDAEKDVQNLKARQAKNRAQTAEAKKNPDAQARKEQLQKLSKEQKQIQEDLKKTLLKLQKARADAAAQAGEQAASKMSKAGQEQEEGDADDAEKAQEEALAGLEEVQDEVEEARKDAEEQLAMEQLSKIKDHLQGLAERQDKMSEETAEYDKAREKNKGLSLAQRASVRSLGRVQSTLKDEAAELAERLDAAPTFALQLKKAGDRMAEAAEKLQALKTDDETQKAEQTAAKRIKQLLDALKPDNGEGGQNGGGQQGGQGGQGGQQGRRRNGDGIGLASQLKVLKLLQLEINDRTEEIDEIKARKKSLTPEQQAELNGLAEDQRKIADLARDLTKPRKSDGEQ